MQKILMRKIELWKQYVYSIVPVLVVAGICYALTPFMGYRVSALVLLVTVSIIAVTFEILPVLLAAALSAFIWDFFFIPPHFTIHVASTEDTILLIMYFIIAMVNAVLTYKIRQIEKLAQQRKEKSNAVKMYNTLFNSLSHELKTPIAAIIGASDNLQAENENLTTEDKKQLVNEISKASFRLNRQVENLLNMSRIESGFLQPKKDWCDIAELLYEVAGRIEAENADVNINISIDPSLPMLKTDKGILEQVLYNLLMNAVRYAGQHSSINIVANYKQHKLQLVIEDNGPGFPQDEIDFVFEKFYRLKNTTGSGTGLGLSIVKGFTEALGGTVQLQNKATGGAIFTLQIPAESSTLKQQP
jgi:two-component system sensor histidine kinase KdpD